MPLEVSGDGAPSFIKQLANKDEMKCDASEECEESQSGVVHNMDQNDGGRALSTATNGKELAVSASSSVGGSNRKLLQGVGGDRRRSGGGSSSSRRRTPTCRQSCSSCNCRCVSYGTTQYSFYCGVCYSVLTELTFYRTKADSDAHTNAMRSNIQQSFTRDRNAWLGYTSQYRAGSNHDCYFDPDSPSDVVWQKGYTAWKWVLTALPIASLFLLFFTVTAKMFGGLAAMAIWSGFLLPFVFFLPLACDTHIKEGGRIACFALGCLCLAGPGAFSTMCVNPNPTAL